jgi:hypothetical protein
MQDFTAARLASSFMCRDGDYFGVFLEMKITVAFLTVALAAFSTSTVCAQSYMVLGVGQKPDRLMIYADGFVRDRTPVATILGPERIVEMKTNFIFEAPAKPEWIEMTLQFSCMPGSSPTPQPTNGRARRRTGNAQPVADVPTRFSVVEGREYARNWALKDVPSTAFAPLNDAIFTHLGKVACNNQAILAATRNAFEGQAFNMSRFNASLAPIGLSTLNLVSEDTDGRSLSNLTWNKFWTDGVRKPMDGGRILSDAEHADSIRKLEAMAATVVGQRAVADASTRAALNASNATLALDQQAARIRGNRRISPQEAGAIQAWFGKRESEVAIAMGPAQISNMDGLRFLSYAKTFEIPVTLLGNSQGQTVGEVGGSYARCDVRFVMATDASGVARVADVRIQSSGNDLSYSNYICKDVIKAPTR